MKLTVVLGASSEAFFDVHLNDNPFVRKWTEELQWCLNNCDFNQQEAFWSLIPPEESANILINACITINRYLKNFIEIRDDLYNQPQDYFNYLHSKFEQLGGNFEKPTRLFTLASPELKEAIRNLNLFVHRVETKKQPYPSLYISFDKNQYRRKALTKADYDNFEFSGPPGTLFLHYVELGKEFIDLYEDNLDLTYSGFKNLHYYSGEAWLLINEYNPMSNPGYLNWLIKQGINPDDKKLGHGKIPLGHIEDLEDVKNKLQQYKYIKEIIIND